MKYDLIDGVPYGLGLGRSPVPTRDFTLLVCSSLVTRDAELEIDAFNSITIGINIATMRVVADDSFDFGLLADWCSKLRVPLGIYTRGEVEDLLEARRVDAVLFLDGGFRIPRVVVIARGMGIQVAVVSSPWQRTRIGRDIISAISSLSVDVVGAK